RLCAQVSRPGLGADERRPMGNDALLEWYLTDVARRGEEVERYLATRRAIPQDVAIALRTMAWIHRAPRPVPSPEFRARVRLRLATASQGQVSEPARHPSPLNPLVLPFRRPAARFRPTLRPVAVRFAPSLRRVAVPLAAGLTLMVAVEGVFTASASALPETPLYPAKLPFEQLTVLAALTPEQQSHAH